VASAQTLAISKSHSKSTDNIDGIGHKNRYSGFEQIDRSTSGSSWEHGMVAGEPTRMKTRTIGAGHGGPAWRE
jgi:hypothetical protein